MRKHLLIGAVGAMLTACAFGGQAITWTITTGTNAAANVTGYADTFTGELDEIAVYTDAGVTGAVHVVALDPFSGTALVLATNATVTGYEVWTPRMDVADVGGSTARVVTNTASADRFTAQGERFYAVVGDASATGKVFRIRLKIK